MRDRRRERTGFQAEKQHRYLQLIAQGVKNSEACRLVAGLPVGLGRCRLADYAKDVLVEPGWVLEHLGDDSLRIIEVDENPALYDEAHIPGALGLDWRCDLQDPVRRRFLGRDDFARLFGRLGVSDRHVVIVYGPLAEVLNSSRPPGTSSA